MFLCESLETLYNYQNTVKTAEAQHMSSFVSHSHKAQVLFNVLIKMVNPAEATAVAP